LCDTVVWARGVLNGPKRWLPPRTVAAFTGGGAEGLARYAYPTDEEKQAMQNRAGRPYQGALAAPAEHGPLGLAFGTA
jgi:hypothetical protein